MRVKRHRRQKKRQKWLEAPIPTAPEVGVTQRYSPTATEMLEAEHDADPGSPFSCNGFY